MKKLITSIGLSLLVGFSAMGQGILETQPLNPSAKTKVTTSKENVMKTEITAPTPVLRAVFKSDNENMATIVLKAGDVWGDGSGYQMLLDADHDTFGTIIPEQGPLTTGPQVPAGLYDNFEYKIPENADGDLNTQNIIIDSEDQIEIPAGIYDYCIVNPSPGDRIWIASNSVARADDFNFEAGKTYLFEVSLQGVNDFVELTITTGLAEVSPDFDAKLHYDASSKEIRIASANNILSVSVYDIAGRKAYAASNLNTANYELSTQSMNTGVYIVVVRTIEGTKTFKVIVR